MDSQSFMTLSVSNFDLLINFIRPKIVKNETIKKKSISV